MALEQTPKRSLGDTLQNLPRPLIYLLLILAASVPLFFTVKLPDIPSDEAIDLYASLMAVPDGSTVLLSSDWTNSTRAESRAEFDAVVRILMRKHVKFVSFSVADPAAPQVAKDEIAVLNEEQKAHGEPTYEEGKDWVDAGYFPSAEATAISLAGNVKATFQGHMDTTPDGRTADITTSPVLQNVATLHDIPLFIDVTGSSTSNIYIERISSKVKMSFLVTGVMGPELVPYYSAGQVKGLAKGLRGVFDLETVMDTGINVKGPDGKVTVSSSKVPGEVPASPGRNAGQGTTYSFALHITLLLLILAIVVGNVGMFLSKREKQS
jgi:hypothetical protein